MKGQGWLPSSPDLFRSKPLVKRWAHFLEGALIVALLWPVLAPGWALAISLAACFAWEWSWWWGVRLLRKVRPQKLLTVRRTGWPALRSDVRVRVLHVSAGGEPTLGTWSMSFQVDRDPAFDRDRPSALDCVPWILGAAAGTVLALVFRHLAVGGAIPG